MSGLLDAFDILRLVAETTGVSPGAICGRGQGHGPSTARHLCWYLMHTGLGMRQRDVALFFDVERRALQYGIRRIEDRRDDAAFDALVTNLEHALKNEEAPVRNGSLSSNLGQEPAAR